MATRWSKSACFLTIPILALAMLLALPTEVGAVECTIAWYGDQFCIAWWVWHPTEGWIMLDVEWEDAVIWPIPD